MHKVYDRFDYFTNKFRKFIVLIVFILIALTSIFNLKNFGVAQDEYFSRSFGFINLNYVGQKFIPEQTIKFKSDKMLQRIVLFFTDCLQVIHGLNFKFIAEVLTWLQIFECIKKL